jgi:hypothetical protein
MPKDKIVEYLKFILACERPRIEQYAANQIERRNYSIIAADSKGNYCSVSIEAIVKALEEDNV